MRFETIEEFDIEELLLDKGNYRFFEASDQDECIAKIYASKPKNFRTMMKSLAEDDLGEVLLVYRDPEAGPIVYDGNRRLSALKVLYDPDKAPAPIVKKEAAELAENLTFNFSAIQAQVTDDRDLALKTVFERHAGSTGVSQISWSALANATFRFENGILIDDKEWHDIAMLMEAVHANDDVAEFVYNGKYSHDVFRRIMRSAFQLNAVPKAMFSERNKRIKKKPKARFEDALELTIKYLQGMEAGRLTLSRKGDTYADKQKVDTFVKGLMPSAPPSTTENDGGGTEENDDPENTDAETTSTGNGGDTHGNGTSTSDDEGTATGNHDPIEVEGDEDGNDRDIEIDDDKPTRIKFSQKTVERLNQLKSRKLNSLARSFENVSLRTNPAMVMVSAWSFWETVSRSLGANDGTSFDAFLNSKINTWFSSMDKGEKNSMKLALSTISKEGNSNKHCKKYFTVEPTQLPINFLLLEPLLLRALDELIAEKESDGW